MDVLKNPQPQEALREKADGEVVTLVKELTEDNKLPLQSRSVTKDLATALCARLLTVRTTMAATEPASSAVRSIRRPSLFSLAAERATSPLRAQLR